MPVADCPDDPAQTVIVPCADVWIVPFRIRCFLIYRLTKYIAVTLPASAIPTIFITCYVTFLFTL